MIRAIISLLLLLHSSICFGADSAYRRPFGVVRGTVHTQLNGASFPSGSSVFENDKLISAEKEIAEVSISGGTSVRALGASSLTLHSSWSQLDTGSASVNTKTRYALRGKGFEAQPASEAETVFTVVLYQNRAYITAEKGPVTVKAKNEVRVPPGKTIAISDCGKPTEVIWSVPPDQVPAAILGGAAGWGAFIIPTLKISAESPGRGR